MKKRKELYICIILYFLITLLLSYKYLGLLTIKNYIVAVPGYSSLYSEALYHIFNVYTWNLFFSIPNGIKIFSYRYFLSFLYLLTPSQAFIITKILIQFFSFLGIYILLRYYFTTQRISNILFIKISLIIGSLLYGICPSYFIGDRAWIEIEIAYATLPWILWSFNKVILEKNWKFVIVCAFIIALNTGEHFLWAGFPIILALYSGFIFLMKSVKEKRINLHPILSFLSVIAIFTLLISYKLIIRFISFSPYSYALTKAGLDICWREATMLNMLRAMSHMSLPNIYVPPQHTVFQFLNSLMPLTLIIPAIAFLALIFYRKNWVVIFYGLLLIISILPFYVGSPFKWIHYWIFFHTPIGPAFRTWRVPDAYISLSLSILLAFLLYYIFERLHERRKHVLIGLITAGILFLFCVYSWPLLTGDVNGYLSPVKVPKEYKDVYNYFKNISGDYRVIYVPDFSHSYGFKSLFKPFWSKKWGMIPAFLFFSSPKPTIPNGWSGIIWNPYYKFTLSYYYWSVLRRG